MNLLFRRYTRSGYAPPWFYAAVALGFAGLAIWALVRMDWIVTALAIVMIPATIAGARLMRRLGEASGASRREVAELERRRHTRDE